MAEPTTKLQIVDGDGQFRVEDLDRFAKDVKLTEAKSDYQIVAIMGPQSSGKSTLLNHVGIWMSRSSKIQDHLTLVMDLEGNDGRERGEDDTNFERQIALFALAVADVLLVNIWCHDIGREQGSGKPLLKTIFQVNLKLFAPEPNRRKTVLLFVIRDKSRTPLPKLVEVLEDDLNKMWDTISKPSNYQNSRLSDFFDVQYAGMSHFEEKYEEFCTDAAILRRRFTPDGDDTLVRPNDHLPGGALPLSVHGIWDTIKHQKDLNLPAHKIMVANVRCAEIARDQLAAFEGDQAWQSLAAESGAGWQEGQPLPELLPGFNTRLQTLMDSCISGYEEEALYFDSKVRSEKLEDLQTKLCAVVHPAITAQTTSLHTAQLKKLNNDLLLGLMPNKDGSAAAEGKPAPPAFASVAENARAAAVSAFKKAFNEHLKIDRKEWDGKDALAAFERDVDAQISKLRSQKISDAVSAVKKALSAAVSGPVTTLLDTCPEGLWPKLHSVTSDAAARAESSLLQALSGFKLTSDEAADLARQVKAHAAERMQAHVQEAALTRLSRMKDRFQDLFTLDASRSPRLWTPRENIPAIAAQARLSCAQLLAQLTVQRPPAKSCSSAETAAMAAVEAAVMALARADIEPGQGVVPAGHTNSTASNSSSSSSVPDIQSIASWPGVPEDRVLVEPHHVRTTWRDFISATNALIQQAQSTQQANRAAAQRGIPAWGWLLILGLGWNEIMAVVWNPVLLILGLIVFLFGRSLYQELDVDTEMSRGSLPGAIALATKFPAAIQTVVGRTKDALSGFLANPAETIENVKHLAQELELPKLDTPLLNRRRPEEASVEALEKKHLPDKAGNSSSSHGVSAAGLTKRRAPGAGESDGLL